ncbi:MAG: 50S ribosomal protein L4 [Nitrospirae bacterium]|nr:50S ribosomal protein L4 [Nitrospirota bacterium]
MEAIPVYGSTGEKVDSVELNEGVFGSSVNESLVHRAVVMQRASSRQGSASTKGRGEVRGSGKKPWKQKHTGRARAGSARSPIWRHGGIVFGPKPRSYAYHLPKKVYRAALKSALTDKASSGELIVIDLSLSEMKTKELVRFLSRVGATGKVVLVVEEGLVDILRIGKNVQLLKVLHAKDLNVYDLLWCDRLVVSQAELQKIQEMWV